MNVNVRQKTVDKYFEYLNELAKMRKGDNPNVIAKECGVNSCTAKTMRELGWLKEEGSNGSRIYSLNLPEVSPFYARRLAEKITNRAYEYAQKKEQEEVHQVDVAKDANKLQNTPTEVLLKELSRRGYTGKLIIQREVVVE